MTNLFSTFDPSTSMMSLAWLSIPMAVIPLQVKMWKMISTTEVVTKKVISIFKKEVSYTLGSTEKGAKMMVITMFVSILPMNFLALYPQIFSPTAHLTITLPLSLTTWMTIMAFGWIKNTNHMLSHLLPQGTPVALMNFMVMIELVSNLIRPITLCVRLTANMIAGHLLMSLLGNALLSLSAPSITLSLLAPTILAILESAVACIQAYVFMTLITLYTAEIK
uniref:ATP synthase F0 subunit 6 n=1 Tax=Allonothrus sinicus TaxID=3138099 RepID=UPI00315C6756